MPRVGANREFLTIRCSLTKAMRVLVASGASRSNPNGRSGCRKLTSESNATSLPTSISSLPEPLTRQTSTGDRNAYRRSDPKSLHHHTDQHGAERRVDQLEPERNARVGSPALLNLFQSSQDIPVCIHVGKGGQNDHEAYDNRISCCVHALKYVRACIHNSSL